MDSNNSGLRADAFGKNESALQTPLQALPLLVQTMYNKCLKPPDVRHRQRVGLFQSSARSRGYLEAVVCTGAAVALRECSDPVPWLGPVPGC